MTPEEARIRARVLELERLRSQKQPGVLREVASEGIRGMVAGGLPGGVVRGLAAAVPPLMEAENEFITQQAYKAGGAATDLASKAGVSPEVAGGVGVAANMATQAIPTVAGGEVSKILTSPTLQWMGKKLMGSALKPTLADRMSGKADKGIQTLLDEGINVSKGGVDVMEKRIGEINKRIEEVIASSRSTIDKTKILSRLEEVKKKFKFDPGDVRAKAEADIDAVATNFANQPEIAGVDQIPIQTAQRLKQGYQRSVGDKGYGLGVQTPTIRGEKSVATSLRTDIANAEPIVGPLNAREKGLIDAVKMAKRRAGMEENNAILGMAPITTNPGAFIAMLADKWGLTKSVVARILYNAPRPAGQAAGAGAGLLSEMGDIQHGH